MVEFTLIFIFRIITVVLGMIVLGLGLYSHSTSTWARDTEERPKFGKLRLRRANFKTCEFDKETIGKKENPCPDITMEQYYVIMIVTCFILSGGLLVVSFLVNMATYPFKLIDMVYHILAAVLLLISAAFYIVSAILINNIYGKTGKIRHNVANATKRVFRNDGLRFEEKLTAGGLTVVQAILFVVVAWLAK